MWGKTLEKMVRKVRNPFLRGIGWGLGKIDKRSTLLCGYLAAARRKPRSKKRPVEEYKAAMQSDISCFTKESLCLTTLDVLQTFPLYVPYSAGEYEGRSKLAIKSINQTLPLLDNLLKNLQSDDVKEINIEEFGNGIEKISENLKKLFDFHKSDKALFHNYYLLYSFILKDQHCISNIFEIGLGTNNEDIVSNMGAAGKPGASLRAFKEFCPNAQIYGADVDKRILFNEERIKTFFVDQTNQCTFDNLLPQIPKNFDLVIDDGLHATNANISSLDFALKIIKVGGWIVIEDIGRASVCLWKIVSRLLPENYKSYIITSKGGFAFAVQRIL